MADILVEALDEIQEPITDFDTLWALFSFCLDNVSDTKYLDAVLTKAPESMKHKLLVNYEDGREHNVVWQLLGQRSQKKDADSDSDMMDFFGEYDSDMDSDYLDYLMQTRGIGKKSAARGNEKTDNAIMEVVLKHIEKPKLVEVLNDVANPKSKEKRDYQSALEKVVAEGDGENFERIKKIFADSKEDFEERLTASDSTGEPLLFKAIKKGDEAISTEILNAFGSDAAKMKVFNIRTKSDRSNVFANAKKNGLIKKTIDSILDNIKSNKLKCGSFIPYFHWLITNNDLQSIKALFEIFDGEKNAITKFMTSRLPDKRNVIALCCTRDTNEELLEFLLPKVLDLRKIMMNRSSSNSITLSRASQKCKSIILKYVEEKDPELLKELLREDDYALVRGHVQSKERLAEMLAYCEGRVLNEEVIKMLLTINGWSEGETRDEIRAILMDKCKDDDSKQKMYLKVAIAPSTGNIPLFECLIKGNGKLFDTIKDAIDFDYKPNLDYLIGYKNYQSENLFSVSVVFAYPIGATRVHPDFIFVSVHHNVH